MTYDCSVNYHPAAELAASHGQRSGSKQGRMQPRTKNMLQILGVLIICISVVIAIHGVPDWFRPLGPLALAALGFIVYSLPDLMRPIRRD